MHFDDANRPIRAPLPRDDEARDGGRPGTLAKGGYETIARRPRIAGYHDLVEPERADRIEGIVRGYEDSMSGISPGVEVEVEDYDD